jgi:hypothetical protein
MDAVTLALLKKDIIIPATNIISNGNFDTTTGWDNYASYPLSATNNIMSITGNGAAHNPMASFITTTQSAVGKKIYLRYGARITNSVCTKIRIEIDGVSSGTDQNKEFATPTENVWYGLSNVFTQPADVSGLIMAKIAHFYADKDTANGKVMEVKKAIAIDLTSTFGVGNEPTADEMDSVLACFDDSWFSGTRNISKALLVLLLNKLRAIQTLVTP